MFDALKAKGLTTAVGAAGRRGAGLHVLVCIQRRSPRAPPRAARRRAVAPALVPCVQLVMFAGEQHGFRQAPNIRCAAAAAASR